jgi:hypothetical protein
VDEVFWCLEGKLSTFILRLLLEYKANCVVGITGGIDQTGGVVCLFYPVMAAVATGSLMDVVNRLLKSSMDIP